MHWSLAYFSAFTFEPLSSVRLPSILSDISHIYTPSYLAVALCTPGRTLLQTLSHKMVWGSSYLCAPGSSHTAWGWRLSSCMCMSCPARCCVALAPWLPQLLSRGTLVVVLLHSGKQVLARGLSQVSSGKLAKCCSIHDLVCILHHWNDRCCNAARHARDHSHDM